MKKLFFFFFCSIVYALRVKLLKLHKRCTIADIGAVIGKPPGYPKVPESTSLRSDYYDGVFFIRNSTSTKLLK